MSAQPTTNTHDPGLYGAFAGDYESILVPTHFDAPNRDLLSMVEPTTCSRLLDIGSGTGNVLDHCATEGRCQLAAGIDPSIEMLDIARFKGHTRIAAAAVPGLPFPASAFQAVVASFVLSHVDSPNESLRDMVRVLSSDGCLAVSSWGDAEDTYRSIWTETVGEFIDQEHLNATVHEAIPNVATFETLSNLESVLERAGLTSIRTRAETYETSVSLVEYAQIRSSVVPSRIMARQLGPVVWQRFLGRALERLTRAFSEPLTFWTTVNMATGIKA